MERKVKQLAAMVWVIGALAIVSLGLNLWPLVQRAMPIPTVPLTVGRPVVKEAVEQNAYDPDDPEQFADNLVTNRKLLQLADSPRYRKATLELRVALIKKWCSENVPKQFNDMEEDDQRSFLRDLEKRLDDMLAEKDFAEPKA